MVGELVMLPVRLSVRATRLWFRAVEETFSVTSAATGRLIELVASRGSDGTTRLAPRPNEPDRFSAPEEAHPAAPPEPTREFQHAPGAVPAEAAASAPPDPASAPPPSPAATPPAEPAHVSEEPVLVQEFAEPGAEEGAGAEVHVDPPWDGYERMTAKEIVARLGRADAAELAAVELYEATTRRRQTIVHAVERELRRANGIGSRRNRTQRG